MPLRLNSALLSRWMPSARASTGLLRRPLGLGIAGVLVLVAASLLLRGNNGLIAAQQVDVSARIKKVVAQADDSRFDLRAIAAFEWDEVYFFAPRSPRATICERLLLDESGCRAVVSDTQLPGDVWLLAFKHDSRLVHVDRHPIAAGDFGPLLFPTPLAPAEAQFRIERRANGLPPTLIHQSLTES